MLSLAIVSLSLCSAAISSSTGATILHGPHHSAQKSTSTGLSLPSTSGAKLASVTVLVLPAMVVLSVVVLGLLVTTGEQRLLCPVRHWTGPCAGSRRERASGGGHRGPSSARRRSRRASVRRRSRPRRRCRRR